MIDIEWVGDIPEADKVVLMQWLLRRKMEIGDTQGEFVQLPSGRSYNFKIFREDEPVYEITFERAP